MKHAFLIVAHSDYELLQKQIEMLDDNKVDIFIHINKLSDMPPSDITSRITKSKVFFTANRYKVTWGAEGLVRATTILLEEAHQKDHYDYYHLLSGVDLPIKTVDEFDEFLNANMYNNNSVKYKTNYIDARVTPNRDIVERSIHYNFLIKYWRHPRKVVRGVIKILNIVSHGMQRLLKIDRLKNTNMNLYYGIFWSSLSDEFVDYLVDNKNYILENYDKHSFAPDEAAVQTLFMNSIYSASKFVPTDKNMSDNLRELDFVRGGGTSPCVFNINDYEMLSKSSNFIARKFSTNIDSRIIDAFYKSIRGH